MSFTSTGSSDHLGTRSAVVSFSPSSSPQGMLPTPLTHQPPPLTHQPPPLTHQALVGAGGAVSAYVNDITPTLVSPLAHGSPHRRVTRHPIYPPVPPTRHLPTTVTRHLAACTASPPHHPSPITAPTGRLGWLLFALPHRIASDEGPQDRRLVLSAVDPRP